MPLPYTGERFMPGWGGPEIHLEHLHRYHIASAMVNGVALDLGCGVGYGSRLLAGGARRVVGLDASPAAVRFASSELAAQNLSYLVGDARSLPFASGTFDWIVCFELIEHLTEIEDVVAEIARVLAPGGQLLLSTPNRPVYSESRGYSNPFHCRELDLEELRSLLTPRFGEITFLGQYLVAGSATRPLEDRSAPDRRLLELRPEPDLAARIGHGGEPTYLLALCSRSRKRSWSPAFESVMTGSLETFLEEQASERRQAEAEIHADYRAMVERLVGQLGEFDARIRELGGEIEKIAGLREPGAAEEALIAALRKELSALHRELLAGEQWRHAVFEAKVRRLEEERAAREQQTRALRLELERTRADLYWSYERWQKRKTEAEAIQRSKMWRLWMAYQSARRAALAPAGFARRAARAAWGRCRWLAKRILQAPARFLGWIYLAGWTANAWLGALRRGRGLPRAASEPTAAAISPARRPRILIVCPYPLHPADHGGGVRIFNMVRRLSRHCDIHLLIFIQGDDDPAQRRALEPLVQKLHFHHWRPRLQQDLWGLESPGAQLFKAPEVRALVNEILSLEHIDILQVEYTELGQYGLPRYARVKVVLSEIDIAFRSSARRRRTGMHRRYEVGRIFGYSLTDWMRQFRYELQVTRRADQVHVMSPADGAYLARFLPDGWRRIRVVPNAVDLDLYRPPAEPQGRGRQLLFVGNFDHLPNLDALDYLARDCWPQIRQRVPDAELLVVGARAGEQVRRYHGHDGIAVVGAVPTTLPYYQRSRALVAPIRAGSGTRLKILEALACGTPVVTTTIGAEGIDGLPGRHFLIADTTPEMIDAVCRLLEDDELCARLGREGRGLAERLYGWDQSVAAALAGYAMLLEANGDDPERSSPVPVAEAPVARDEVDVSVIIPTLNGGALLESCLAAIRRQRTQRSVEIVCVDSGSPAADLEAMKRHGARLIRIDRAQFNHGLTRDLGADASRGRALVFLNQDAVPRDLEWLENLVAPLFAANGCAAVQGAILEMPDPSQRFYWHSCGDRFYFTSETRRWLERYFGIGFSTVNAAIRREVWQRHPFGNAPIMEDKKWQREVVEAGHGIATAPQAVVHHTHDYGMKSLFRRCESEGFGWRTLGETYSLRDMLFDISRPGIYADLLKGLARGQIRSWAELLFPVARPLLLFRGNRWGRAVKL